MVQNDMESNIKYFSELIKSLQEKGSILKNEIENTQQYLATLPYNNNVTIDGNNPVIFSGFCLGKRYT